MTPFRRLGDPWKVLGGYGGTLGALGRGGAFVEPVVFLFRDDFLTDEGAPMVSPRTAEPGPGTGTIVDSGNNLDIVGQALVFSGYVADGDPGYWSEGFARSVGLAHFNRKRQSDDTWYGWDQNQATVLSYGFRSLNTELRVYTVGITASLGNTVSGTQYTTVNILRTTGQFMLVKGGIYTEWTLLWRMIDENFVTVYASLVLDVNKAGDTLLDYMRVSQLPTPWDTDNGIATQVLAGARSAGDTFTHEADCLIEFEMTTVPAGGQAEVHFRIQDATNYWAVTINAAGDLELDEVVGGGTTQRGVSAGAVGNGDRVVIIAAGQTITVFSGERLRITYALATNFQTETSGELNAEGAGGSVSDIIAWPRIISGDALTALDRVADA